MSLPSLRTSRLRGHARRGGRGGRPRGVPAGEPGAETEAANDRLDALHLAVSQHLAPSGHAFRNGSPALPLRRRRAVAPRDLELAPPGRQLEPLQRLGEHALPALDQILVADAGEATRAIAIRLVDELLGERPVRGDARDRILLVVVQDRVAPAAKVLGRSEEHT